MLSIYRGRGSAFDSLADMSRDLDRLAETVWSNGGDSRTWSAMPAEVLETGDSVQFNIEVPGVRPEDLDITLENNVLTISGEKKQEHEEGGSDSDYRLVERRYGRFQRSFAVPPTVRSESCEARYDNGVLTVRLPKAEEAKPRRIRVEAAPSSRQVEQSTRG